MDLQGKILSIKSYKEISRAEIIKNIISYGKAVLISTDVYPPPKMVKKLATSLNAKLHHPLKDMSVGSKIELVDSYLGEKSSQERSKVIPSEEVPQDAHQRDALAAAIKTYQVYQKKLDQIETRSKEINLSSEQIDYVKILVIDGNAITKAIRIVQEMNKISDEEISNGELSNRETSEEELNITESPFYKSSHSDFSIIPKLRQKTKIQEKQITNLKNKNSSLEKEIHKYKNKTAKLQDKVDKLHYEYTQDILFKKEMVSKISLIKNLQDKYNQEKRLRLELETNLKSLKNIQTKNPTENAIPVKIIETFTRDGIKQACEYWKIKKGDVVLLKSSEGGGSQTAALLINMGVKAVLIMDTVSHNAQEEFEKNMVPLLQANTLKMKMIDQFAIINAFNLKKEIHRWKAETENKMAKENNQEILKVFDEYRARRKRSIDM